MAKIGSGVEQGFNEWLKTQKPGLAGSGANLILNGDPLFIQYSDVWNKQHPDSPINKDGSTMSTADKVIFDAQGVRGQNQATIDKFSGGAIPDLKAAGAGANTTANTILAGRAANIGQAKDADAYALNQFGTDIEEADASQGAAVKSLGKSVAGATKADKSAVSDYAGAADDANRWDASEYDLARGALDGTQRVTPGGYGANLTSAAAQAKADPNAIGVQNNVIQRILQQSSAPGIHSDAADASADPESIAAQKFALSKYKTLSDPSISPEEMYMKELARQEEEQGQAASLGAAKRDLASRGVLSGGAEIGSLLGSGQITSQNRMLRDMAANAAASARATNALSAYTGTAGNIRGQSFNEKFDTGQAGDAMAVGNRGYAAGELDKAGALASTVRDESFGEQFQTGSATDVIAKFNKDQSLAQQRWADELNVKQNNDNINNSLNVAKFGTGVNAEAFARAGGVLDAKTGQIDRQAMREKGMTDAQIKLAEDTYSRGQDNLKATTDYTDTNFDRYDQGMDDWTAANDSTYDKAGDVYKAERDATAMKTDQYTTDSNAIAGGQKQKVGIDEERRAEKKVEDDKGLLEKLQDSLGL